MSVFLLLFASVIYKLQNIFQGLQMEHNYEVKIAVLESIPSTNRHNVIIMNNIYG